MSTVCLVVACALVSPAAGFWDIGTTTVRDPRDADESRTSFFRWQWTYMAAARAFFNWWDWTEIDRRQRLGVIAGISIDWQCITTATILSRRVLLTAYNSLHPHIIRQWDLRIWAPGRAGRYNTPYRYRVHRVHPMFPRSGNPEHCHGLYCVHQPRHDLCIIISKDQIYLFASYWLKPFEVPTRYFYPFRARLAEPYNTLKGELWFAGSGFEYLEHIHENYKIFFGILFREHIVDCSKYIPKWWGKFICIRNRMKFPGIQNGGGLFTQEYPFSSHSILVGVGCFEIRINDEMIYAFTDVRFYTYKIKELTDFGFRSYYEFAYPQWMVPLAWNWMGTDSNSNDPRIPWDDSLALYNDGYLLGK